MKAINHVGYVVRSIDAFRGTLPPCETIKAVEDPIQHAKIVLLGMAQGAAIELIEPQGSESFTWNFLQKYGEGLHHICYEGYSLDEIDTLFRELKMIKLRGPIPAILFDRDVLFAMTRSKSVVEFLL